MRQGYKESDSETPSHILSALEDLNSDILELSELVAFVALSADRLNAGAIKDSDKAEQ